MKRRRRTILFPERNDDDDVSWLDSHLIPAVATVKHFIAIMNQVVLCVQNNDLDDFEQEEYISAKGTNWGQFQRTSTQPQSAQPQSVPAQSVQAQSAQAQAHALSHELIILKIVQTRPGTRPQSVADRWAGAEAVPGLQLRLTYSK